MKVMITIPDGLLQKLDYHAEKNYKTRSGMIQDLIIQYCSSHDYIEAIKELRDFAKQNSKMIKYNTEECEAFKTLVKRLDI